MSEEVAHQAVRYISSISPINTGVVFFGGEPLLCKDVIESTIDECENIQKISNSYFHYKISTNGMLLDSKFLHYANNAGLAIHLSIDGIPDAHDLHRRDIAGNPSFEKVLEKAKLLLQFQPYAAALVVISPETVKHYADSIEFLMQTGFKYLIVSLNYAGNWKNTDLAILKAEYKKLSRLYEQMSRKEKKFYFSPFEVKLSTHIKGKEAHCQRCVLGKNQVSIAPDGSIYPCIQFVGDGVSNKSFAIGDVWNGIDQAAAEALYQSSQLTNQECSCCALKDRCNHSCSCLNWQTTGAINSVSPIMCESEKILIPIVDEMGHKLYKSNAAIFIQKHYNAVFPLISLMEDANYAE